MTKVKAIFCISYVYIVTSHCPVFVSLSLRGTVLCGWSTEPTRILNAPEHLSSTRGATARFNCRIKHDPSLSIQVTWLKNGEPLNLAFWR